MDALFAGRLYCLFILKLLSEQSIFDNFMRKMFPKCEILLSNKILNFMVSSGS